MVDDCASERCVRRPRAVRRRGGAASGLRACGRLSRGARRAGAAGPPGLSAGLAAFSCWQPAATLCAPPHDSPRSLRLEAPGPGRRGPAARAASPASRFVSRCWGIWWSAPGRGRGGRWRRAGAARAWPGAAIRGAGTPLRAPGRLDALMESPWEIELELRRHIENCACTCDHMGYGNYMDYQVAPAAHACLCRAITSPHAHVRVPRGAAAPACLTAYPGPVGTVPC